MIAYVAARWFTVEKCIPLKRNSLRVRWSPGQQTHNLCCHPNIRPWLFICLSYFILDSLKIDYCVWTCGRGCVHACLNSSETSPMCNQGIKCHNFVQIIWPPCNVGILAVPVDTSEMNKNPRRMQIKIKALPHCIDYCSLPSLICTPLLQSKRYEPPTMWKVVSLPYPSSKS